MIKISKDLLTDALELLVLGCPESKDRYGVVHCDSCKGERDCRIFYAIEHKNDCKYITTVSKIKELIDQS